MVFQISVFVLNSLTFIQTDQDLRAKPFGLGSETDGSEED